MALRPYQEEAVGKALAAKHSTVKAATGTGKTVIAISWLQRVNQNSLVIVPTQALVHQAWAPKLEKYGFEDVGEYYAYGKRLGNVTITTFASAMIHPELIENAGAVIVDEIHHLGSRLALQRILPKLMEKEYVLGLSSVPERDDKTHEFFLKEFPICFDLTLAEALESGYVSPIAVREIRAPMSPEEKESYHKMTAMIQHAFRFCGPNIQKWRNCFDPKTRQYVGRQAMIAMMRRKKLLSSIESKKNAVLEIINEHPDERIILFSESVPAIERIREFLESQGIRCATYHSRIEPWKRQEILSDWGNSYQVLLSCRALEEGLDVKEVAVGVLLASGKSKRQFIQRIGRVIRPKEGKEAKFYVVFSPETVEETYSPTIARLLSTA